MANPITQEGAIATIKLLGDIVNVRQYGAIGDGVANDTAAIVAAIAAATANGKAVYIPAGTFLTDPITSLSRGMTLCGDGTTSILRSRLGGDVIVLGTTFPQHMTIRLLQIQGTGIPSGTVLDLKQASCLSASLVVSSCQITARRFLPPLRRCG